MNKDEDFERLGAFALELVESDVLAVLTEFFPPRDGNGFTAGPQSRDAGAPLSNGVHTAVVWEYTGVHEKPFAGIAATGAEVTFQAVTIVDHESDPPTLSRYIDWMSVMVQLGVPSFGRPVVAGDTPPPRM